MDRQLPGNRDLQVVDKATVIVSMPTGFREYALRNGNLVVAHWTGHGRQDSTMGPQALEFDKDVTLIWQRHDPKRAGTLHGIEIIE